MATGACVLLSVCVGVCAAFNLDTSFPLLKTGKDGSLFGLSVALHQKKNTYLLLVGAPTEKAEPNVPANRTGGVYSCPITADQSDCTRMELIDPDLDPSEDLVEDMWLGVSVASQGQPGGRVLACGHRFVKFYGTSKLRHMIGRCYIRGNDLKYNENDMQWQDVGQTCSHLGDYQEEGMCNMGISSSITQTEVIVGSPGSFEWQGNVHLSWMNPNDNLETQKSSFPKQDNRRNIYIGYSVTQAHGLLSKDEETIVTGAPKDNRNDAYGSVMLLVKQSKDLVINQTLRGEQTGSYFGNALATIDLDNDGWNDLLVGAPFYFQRQAEVGGAVYVYMNKGGQFDLKHSLRLTGKAGSAFGMAVAAAGDLNQDGFQDFAVGAPFHETGSVMIWTGSSEGISEEPSQVIQGSVVSPGFRTFGYSLSGGLDVDRNKYPDLLVGSLDNMVTLLRSRPVIHLNKTLRVSPDMVDLKNCSFCIQVEVCFSYNFSAGQTSNTDNIKIQFNVTADADANRARPRLQFQDKQNKFTGFLSMPKQKCETLKVGLKSSIRDKVNPLVFSLNAAPYEELPKDRNSVQDLRSFPVLSQTPQPIKKEIHIQKACGSDNICESNLQMTARFTDEKYKPFNIKDGIQVLHYNSNINHLLLEVNISNTGRTAKGQPAEDAHNAILNISIPASLTFAGVRPQNDIECRDVDNYLQCELGNPFESNEKVQRFIVFQIPKITSEIKSELRLSTLSKQDDLSPVNVSMLVEYSLPVSLSRIDPLRAPFSGPVIGESAMKKTADIGSLVLFTFQVHLTGKPLVDLSNLAVEFDWPREVSNGKWLLYITEIQVNGTSEPRCTPPGNIVNPLNLVLSKEEKKVRKRSLEEEVTEEQEEQREEKTLPVLRQQGKRKKVYHLDCLHEAKCVKFVCPLMNMNNSATLTIRARLWNSTMIEDYSDARSVLVRGQATLKLQADKKTVNLNISKTSISTVFEVDIYPDLSQQMDSGAPLWIIVVSVLAGVLLLALICLLLWKCGFFKRASTREIYEAKAQSAHMKSQPSEDDRLTQEL